MDRVLVKIEGGVAHVRLNRPEKMNAVDDALVNSLTAAGERLTREAGVRAVVLSGEGKSFCSGMDRANFGRHVTGERRGDRLVNGPWFASGANSSQQMVMVWREVPVPVIAAVQGAAFGAGLQIALGADIRFVSRDAKLSLMEIRWGLVPDLGAFALLRGMVRSDRIGDLVYSGRTVGAEEALEIGLATRIADDPLSEAAAFAARVASFNPDAIRAAKRLVRCMDDADEATLLRAEAREQSMLIGSPNQKEAVTAALQTRAAVFRDADG